MNLLTHPFQPIAKPKKANIGFEAELDVHSMSVCNAALQTVIVYNFGTPDNEPDPVFAEVVYGKGCCWLKVYTDDEVFASQFVQMYVFQEPS